MRQNLSPLLTSKTAKEILEGKIEISVDLGLNKIKVNWTNSNLYFPGGEKIEVKELEKIANKPEAVYFIKNNKIYQVAIARNHYYKLLPTDGAPTLEIDGIRMHRTKNTTPDKDSLKKIQLLGNSFEYVLDTCTGLGYTAIEALKGGALRVITIELEPNVHRISSMNPWSQKLYQSNEIQCILGDSFHVVDGLPDELFNIIIHDPPRHRYAGHLYGLIFYQKLFRLLKSGGKIFHYTGEPRSKYRGVNISKGVSQRLLKAGFRDVQYHDNVMGLIGFKN